MRTTRGRRADDVRTTCADDVQVTPGVVLHEIGQLRQVFAWVLAINLTSNNNRRSGKSDKRKPSWTALHKDECLTCLSLHIILSTLLQLQSLMVFLKNLKVI